MKKLALEDDHRWHELGDDYSGHELEDDQQYLATL
jgi:hypothetical protein